jgi:hypothetical protein
MANDPLPLPGVSAGSPDDPHDSQSAYDAQSAEASQDAEYEAIHVEIAATERGRWFLSEHVKRNRAADTDRLVDSLARAEAALRGGALAAMPNPFADDLAQLAAAIGQVEAVIAAGGAPAAGGLAASERIQEIAFALREGETDSVLCEALESALFDLGEAFAQHDAAAERAQSAAALLRGLRASISAMIALAAPSSAAERARVPETGEPIWGMVSEVQACTVTPEAAAPASQSEESPSIESAPPDSAGGVVRASEGIEPLALENKQASEVASVAYREWETHASSEAEMPAREIEPHDERLEHIGRSQEPAHEPLASEEILLGSMSGEAVSGEEPSRAPLRSEEAASEQQLLSEEEPREVASSSEASGEEPSVATKLPMHAVTEPAERPPELGAEATDLAVGRPADDENAGTAARSHDTAAQSADDAVETVLSAADDIESLLETEPADSPPTAVQPTSPQEDLDDLFEPLPLEHEARPAVASTATPESAQQMFSPELPPPAFSSPVTQIAASPVQRAPLAAAPAPVAREIPRPAPKDPLAAVRALSEEELIALFS